MREEIVECTARFVANRVSHKLRAAEVDELVERLRPEKRPMRIKRFDWDGERPAAMAAEIRALQPALGEVSESVAAIIDEVREGGDAALPRSRRGSTADRSRPDSLRVPDEALDAAASRLEPESCAALEMAAANIRAVAEAQLAEDRELKLPQGQTVELREVAVASAGIYAPGRQRPPIPSSVLMGCIPAKVAGVERIALASPPGPDGRSPTWSSPRPRSCGVDEVYAMGGAQAIVALASAPRRSSRST